MAKAQSQQLQSQAFDCIITSICVEAQIIAHYILTCGEAQSQQLQSQAFDCIIISDNCNRKRTISSSHRLAQEHKSSQLIRHLFADCGDCDMAQDHIIFTLVHFNGCAGAKAPHSIIFNVGIRRLQIQRPIKANCECDKAKKFTTYLNVCPF